MKARYLLAVPILVVLAGLLAGRSATGERRSLEVRTFEFIYETKIQNIPFGARQVEVWLPYPHDDPYQRILRAEVSAPFATKIYRDSKYGNSIVHFMVREPKAQTISVKMRFQVKRWERIQAPVGQVGHATASSPGDLNLWLGADRLVPLDKRIRDLALEVTAGEKTDLGKARAIYDYVVSNMKYDKSGTGWGNGDVYWACDTKRGNCTDFHALFIGLSRAVGIPAKFAIGFPLPPDKSSGEVAGYHCWAEFYLKDYGWIPVDTSEASKNPGKREYFFGAHDAHRVQFSIGRDIVLNPRQAGSSLNYFIYPYVEVDRKPFPGVTQAFHFQDVGTYTHAAGDGR